MEIRQAIEKEDFLKCWEVVHELRPHLDPDRYLTLMLYMLDESYKMIYIEEEGKAVSFCGYRMITMLHPAAAFILMTSAPCPKQGEKDMERHCWIMF